MASQGLTDVAVPAGVAALSAFLTWRLGRRKLDTEDHDQAFDQAWRLVEGLREEVDRLRLRIGECEAEIEALGRKHDQDRERWATERRSLIAAFRRGDDTPRP